MGHHLLSSHGSVSQANVSWICYIYSYTLKVTYLGKQHFLKSHLGNEKNRHLLLTLRAVSLWWRRDWFPYTTLLFFVVGICIMFYVLHLWYVAYLLPGSSLSYKRDNNNKKKHVWWNKMDFFKLFQVSKTAGCEILECTFHTVKHCCIICDPKNPTALCL